MNRRHFLKQSCLACSGIAALGLVLEACKTQTLINTTVENKTLIIPTTTFIAPEKLAIVRAKELEYDILLIKVSDTNYRALFMQCTHQDNPLVANDKGLYCNTHGSSFSLEGKVQQGPALRDLKEFKTFVENNKIIIQL